MEQNHTEGRGRFTRSGSDQPKPRAGCRQTAQSAKRGCQQVNRAAAEVGDGDMKFLHHAADANAAPLASPMRARMAERLNLRLSMAEAW
jgi:hypothetical protein